MEIIPAIVIARFGLGAASVVRCAPGRSAVRLVAQLGEGHS